MNRPNKKGVDYPQIGSATETTTESEVDIERAITNQKESLAATKATGSEGGKKKVSCKRINSAMFIVSWYFGSLHAGVFYGLIMGHTMIYIFHREYIALYHKKNKSTINLQIQVLSWMWIFTFHFFIAPNTWLTQPLLTRSGCSQEEYPLLHAVMYKYNLIICMCISIINFVIFVLGLREKSLKYQMKNYVASINGSLFIIIAMNGMIISHFVGLFWGILSMGSITINDLFAFFCGKAFGRTHLISLSPNKTLEGFLGGAFWTFIWVIMCASQMFRFPLLICQVQSISLVPFKEVDCPEYENKVYTTYESYNFFGLISFQAKPAMLAAVIFCLFASLAGPFAGFFASGFKRTYKIKDFSNNLPGHGGFFDRFDCMLYMSIFGMCFLSSNFLMRDTIDVESAMGIIQSMSSEERRLVISFLENV